MRCGRNQSSKLPTFDGLQVVESELGVELVQAHSLRDAEVHRRLPRGHHGDGGGVAAGVAAGDVLARAGRRHDHAARVRRSLRPLLRFGCI